MKENNKEKILEEFRKLKIYTTWPSPNGEYEDFVPFDIIDLIDKALDEYADLKIKECLPEKMVNTKEESDTEWFYGTGFNHCIDQILANKDKK